MTKCMLLITSGFLIILNGCEKTNPEKGFDRKVSPAGNPTAQPAAHSSYKLPYHVLQTPGYRYAWSGDFDKDGKIDSLLFGIPEIPDFCNRIAICLNPWIHDSSDRNTDNEPGLLVTLAKGPSYFMRNYLYFPNPETSNMDLEMPIEIRIRIIHPGESDYLKWKSFATFEGDIIGVLEGAAIEMILYFKNGTFQAGYSDEEP